MILARHAEALFWVGRHVERAEATSRCLNYAANAISHLRDSEARIEGEQLIKTLGLSAELALTGSLDSRPQLVAFLLTDTDNPGSIISCVKAVRENLRATRDRIPIELWEEANGLYLRFPNLGKAAPSGGLHEVLLRVRRACLAIGGVLNEGMRRDEAYECAVVGRMLERSIFTVGLLASSQTDPRGAVDINRILRLAAPVQAYHRQHGHAPDAHEVVGYLLHAEDLPRSVLSCLVRAEHCLKGLAGASKALLRCRRSAGLLRARLELGEIESAVAAEPVAALWKLSSELSDLAIDVETALQQPQLDHAVYSRYVAAG